MNSLLLKITVLWVSLCVTATAAEPPAEIDFTAAAGLELVGAVKLTPQGTALFEGGHIKLPRELWDRFHAAGDAASIHLRLKPNAIAPCGLLSMRRADQSAINLSVLSLNRVDTFLNLLTAFPRAPREAAPLDGADAATKKGTFMNAPTEKLPHDEWLDVVFTRDGVKSQLFVNGTLLAYRNMGASYALAAHWFPPTMPKEGVTLGADLDGSNVFHGEMDHLRVWQHALSDDEVRTIFSGRLDLAARERLRSTSDAYADGELYLSDAFGEPGRLNATSRTMKTAFEKMRRDSKTFPLIHPAVPGDSYDIRGVRYGAGYHLFPAVFLGWWHNVRVPAMPYWAHLHSPDLVHWHLMPCPNVPVYNSNGAVVEHEGEAVVLGGWKVPLGSREGPGLRLARTRDPLLRAWANDVRNPIATPLPDSAGLPLEALRDTDAWFDAATKQWNIIATVPYGLRYKAAHKHHLYRSADLRTFDYIGPFHDAGKDDAGSEVPHVFQIGGKLVFSALRPLSHDPLENYQVGHVDESGRFIREGGGFWDHGIGGGHPHEFIGYAHRPDGSVIVWQAIRGFHTLMRERGIKALMADGWSVAYSLPRSVSLKPDHTLAFKPAPELIQLRGPKTGIKTLRGGALELDAEIHPGGDEEILLEIGDRTQTLRLRYSPKAQRLHSERGTAKICAVQASAPLSLKPGEPLKLHVFADRGIVEVFFGDGQVMTNRILPKDSDDLHFTWKLPASAKLVKNEAWPLKTIWREFLE